MRRLPKLAAAGAALLAGLVGAVAPADAANPAGYTPPAAVNAYGGYDAVPQTIYMGGSDTTYRAMVGIADLYNGTAGCLVDTASGSATLNDCVADPAIFPVSVGNFDHDTVVNLNPTGSGAGRRNLNGIGGAQGNYNGAPGGVINMARSSSTPSASELAVSTAWGFGQDGIEVLTFNNRANDTNNLIGAGALSATDMFKVFDGQYTRWCQIPNIGIACVDPGGGANDAPIVPWGMNGASGTYNSFKTYLTTGTGAPAGWDTNTATTVPTRAFCGTRPASPRFPFENDVKPLIDDAVNCPDNLSVTGISSNPLSTNNPENWIWWSSFGELSAFSYKGTYTVDTATGQKCSAPGTGTCVLFASKAIPVQGAKPSSQNILGNTYPIGRTLYHVTNKVDADCPTAGGVNGACNFTGNPGPNVPGTATADINVAGGAGGSGGAVREFTRFLCRPAASVGQSIDPYTGSPYGGEITQAINKAGFTLVPGALVTAGTRCRVLNK